MKTTDDLISQFTSPYVVSQVNEVSGYEVMRIVAMEQSAMSFWEKCKTSFLLNNVDATQFSQATELLEISYYWPEDPNFSGRLWINFNPLPRVSQFHDFHPGDVITIVEGEKIFL